MNANVCRSLNHPLAVHCQRPMRVGFAWRRDDRAFCSRRHRVVRHKGSVGRHLTGIVGACNTPAALPISSAQPQIAIAA